MDRRIRIASWAAAAIAALQVLGVILVEFGLHSAWEVRYPVALVWIAVYALLSYGALKKVWIAHAALALIGGYRIAVVAAALIGAVLGLGDHVEWPRLLSGALVVIIAPVLWIRGFLALSALRGLPAGAVSHPVA